jgi:hypothetical protein
VSTRDQLLKKVLFKNIILLSNLLFSRVLTPDLNYHRKVESISMPRLSTEPYSNEQSLLKGEYPQLVFEEEEVKRGKTCVKERGQKEVILKVNW